LASTPPQATRRIKSKAGVPIRSRGEAILITSAIGSLSWLPTLRYYGAQQDDAGEDGLQIAAFGPFASPNGVRSDPILP